MLRATIFGATGSLAPGSRRGLHPPCRTTLLDLASFQLLVLYGSRAEKYLGLPLGDWRQPTILNTCPLLRLSP
jgi:hypothetical protein